MLCFDVSQFAQSGTAQDARSVGDFTHDAPWLIVAFIVIVIVMVVDMVIVITIVTGGAVGWCFRGGEGEERDIVRVSVTVCPCFCHTLSVCLLHFVRVSVTLYPDGTSC